MTVAGNYLQAIMYFKEALDLDPSNSILLYNLALVHAKLQEWEEAHKLLFQCVEDEPFNPDYWCELGRSSFGLGEKEEAASSYGRALELNPSHSPSWNNLGVIHFLNNRMEEAKHCFKEAVKNDPYHKEAWSNLADCCEELGLKKEAREAQRQHRMQKIRKIKTQ